MAGCSLACRYCDSAAARKPRDEFEIGDGGRVMHNPVGAGELALVIEEMLRESPRVHSLSITGGEPLEQADFMVALIERCRPLDKPFYLETNGLHEKAVERIVPLVDIISLDIKLPSLCGGGDLLGIYEKTLPLVRGREVFCKVVLAGGFDPAEFTIAVDLLSRVDDRIPLVIQPATPVEGCKSADRVVLLDAYREAAGRLRDVRIIPQCHRILGLR
jgi:7-carboxy-7-deazaguanine synthase